MASPFISFFLLLGKPGGWGGARSRMLDITTNSNNRTMIYSYKHSLIRSNLHSTLTCKIRIASKFKLGYIKPNLPRVCIKAINKSMLSHSVTSLTEY